MFETTVVESRVGHSSRARAITLPVSVGLHAFVISGVILANAWSINMPKASPPQFKPFVMQTLPMIPVAVRPPRPATPEPQRSEPAQTQAPRSEPLVDPPPTAIPNHIPNLTPGEATGPIDGPVRWDFDGTGQASDDVGWGLDEPAPTGPITVGVGGATRPVITKRVDPRYPPLLAKIGMAGEAVVECIVEKDGRITSVRIVEATHVLFGESARDAVLQWKFEPGLLNGDPVPTIFQLTVSFQPRR